MLGSRCPAPLLKILLPKLIMGPIFNAVPRGKHLDYCFYLCANPAMVSQANRESVTLGYVQLLAMIVLFFRTKFLLVGKMHHCRSLTFVPVIKFCSLHMSFCLFFRFYFGYMVEDLWPGEKITTTQAFLHLCMT